MNEYLFSQLNVGIKHSFEAEVDEDKMQKFLEISGDNNPMHIDHIFAKSNGMKDRIVYGLLTSSFYSTLVGVYLPGKLALLHSIDIQFSNPVFIGDTITTTVTIKEMKDYPKDPDKFGMVYEACEVLNQNKKCVSYSEHVLLVERKKD